MDEHKNFRELREAMRCNTRRVLAVLTLLVVLGAGACSLVLGEIAWAIESPEIKGWAEQRHQTVEQWFQETTARASKGMAASFPRLPNWAATWQGMSQRGRGLFKLAAVRLKAGWKDFMDRQRRALFRESSYLYRLSERPPQIVDELDEALDRRLGFSLEDRAQAVLGWLGSQFENPDDSPPEG